MFIMKSIFVLSILCLVAVNGKYSKVRRDLKPYVFVNPHQEEATATCARELGLDVHEFDNGIALEDYLKNPTDDKTCMMACMLQKSAHENGTTTYTFFLELIKNAYKEGFESETSTREDAISKVENCFVKERDNCAFFKCVEPFHSPLLEIFVYNFLKTVATLILKGMFS